MQYVTAHLRFTRVETRTRTEESGGLLSFSMVAVRSSPSVAVSQLLFAASPTPTIYKPSAPRVCLSDEGISSEILQDDEMNN